MTDTPRLDCQVCGEDVNGTEHVDLDEFGVFRPNPHPKGVEDKHEGLYFGRVDDQRAVHRCCLTLYFDGLFASLDTRKRESQNNDD